MARTYLMYFDPTTNPRPLLSACQFNSSFVASFSQLGYYFDTAAATDLQKTRRPRW